MSMPHPDEKNPYAAPAKTAMEMAGHMDESRVAASTIDILNQTRPWVQFMGVLGIIATILMAMMVLVLLGAALMDEAGSEVVGASIGYGIAACLYGILSLVLLRYASRIAQLSARPTAGQLNEALNAQKTFWRLIGIVTAVILIMWVLLLAFAFVAGVGSVMI